MDNFNDELGARREKNSSRLNKGQKKKNYIYKKKRKKKRHSTVRRQPTMGGMKRGVKIKSLIRNGVPGSIWTTHEGAKPARPPNGCFCHQGLSLAESRADGLESNRRVTAGVCR